MHAFRHRIDNDLMAEGDSPAAPARRITSATSRFFGHHDQSMYVRRAGRIARSYDIGSQK